MILGVSRYILSILFFLIFLPAVKGQEENNFKFPLESKLQIRHALQENGNLVIDYSIPEINLEKITNEEGDFYRLSIPGHGHSSDQGKPEVPVYSKLISIPEGNDYRIKITDVRSAKLRPSSKRIRGILYPAQESEVKRQVPGRNRFSIDRSAYAKKGIIPSDTVRMEQLGRLRGNNLANLNIFPVRYNPGSNNIEIITSMKIEVIFSGDGASKAVARTGYQESVMFNESMTKGILNYNKELIPAFTNKPAGMIILADTAFRKGLKPFIEWKTQKGFRITTIYRGSALSTYTQIRDTLLKIYNSATEDNPAPDYLLIVGDVNHIPYYGAGGSGNVTDMYYGEFDGNSDYIPELFIGRLPVKDTAELRSVTTKIIQYEKFQFKSGNTFYTKALATAGADAEHGYYMNGQVRYSVGNYLTQANRISEKHFYYPQPDLRVQKDSIIKIINSGASFINYTGHGDQTGWLHVEIKVADTSKLSNRNMYPVIISNACRTAQYNTANSFGNRMVLEKNRGAVGFIGCSNDSYWDEDYYWAVGLGTISDNPTYSGKSLGMFDRLFHSHQEYPADWYFTLGQINYAGNLSVSSSTTNKKKYYWETYNVIGDPSMIPIMGSPDSFRIALPDTLPNGIKSLSLTSEPFSYVAVSHFDKLWDASFAGISGSVTLDLPGLSNDSCLVVITGQNRYPLIKKIYISDVNSEFLNLTSSAVNDLAGNNNRKADFGENFYLNLSLSNLGLTEARSVSVKMSTSSEWLVIEKDSAFAGNIPARTDMAIADKLYLKVLDNVPDKKIATIDLLVKSQNTEKKYKVDLTLHSPVLQIVSCIIDDSVLGNGDHIPDPGETFTIIFRVRNQGSSDASGQLNVSSSAGGLTIFEESVKSGLLKAGETTDIPVTARISEDISSGSFLQVLSVLTSDPFTMSKSFILRAGKVREGFEASSFDVFPWINRSPVPWIVTQSTSMEGSISARSGAITHNGTTSLVIKTFYSVADTLKFYCRISSEANYDFLSFLLNGKEIFRKSGEVPWTKITIPVQAGLNKLEWTYSKDQSDLVVTQDCAWIDMIDFASNSSVRYIRKDLQLAKISLPPLSEQPGQEILTAKVLNNGKDVINGFNLAYSVNKSAPVKQFFDTKVYPGADSLVVTFKTKIDLSKYGIYNITTYGFENNDDLLSNDTLSLQIENTKISEDLRVYPNPYTDQFTVFMNSFIKDKIRMTLTNVSGALVYSSEKSILKGENTIIINDAELVPGLYYLTIRGSMINRTVPVLRLKK